MDCLGFRLWRSIQFWCEGDQGRRILSMLMHQQCQGFWQEWHLCRLLEASHAGSAGDPWLVQWLVRVTSAIGARTEDDRFR